MNLFMPYGNTYNPCLQILRQKGYDLSSEEVESTSVQYLATKGGQTFLGYSPPELLGIVYLWESRGDAWNEKVPDIIAELAENRSKNDE